MERKHFKLFCFKDSKIPHLIIQIFATEKEKDREVAQLTGSGFDVVIKNMDLEKKVDLPKGAKRESASDEKETPQKNLI